MQLSARYQGGMARKRSPLANYFHSLSPGADRARVDAPRARETARRHSETGIHVYTDARRNAFRCITSAP